MAQVDAAEVKQLVARGQFRHVVVGEARVGRLPQAPMPAGTQSGFEPRYSIRSIQGLARSSFIRPFAPRMASDRIGNRSKISVAALEIRVEVNANPVNQPAIELRRFRDPREGSEP